jgi:hypothetical protein
MLIGCPVKFPYHDRAGVPALSVTSSDTIDQAPPDPFVHDSPAVMFGSVTADPAELAADDAVIGAPPAV